MTRMMVEIDPAVSNVNIFGRLISSESFVVSLETVIQMAIEKIMIRNNPRLDIE